nr:unnamed protein product [Spirometra erinaceieuropaei]
MYLSSAACENFGLVINTQKTVVMHQPPPHLATPPNAPPPQISVNGTQLQLVDKLPYLGSTLSLSTKIEAEIAHRILKASQAFGRSQSTSPSPTNSDCSSEPPLPSSSSSSCTAPTTATLAAVMHINITHIPDTTMDTTPTTSDSRGEDQDYTSPHCDRTFTSHIGLVGHLQMQCTEAGEPVS